MSSHREDHADSLEKTGNESHPVLRKRCMPTVCVRMTSSPDRHPVFPSSVRDCADWQADGMTVSGIYGIYLERSGWFIDAYCDMDTAGGGWTVIQRRMDGTVDFDKTWAQYKKGFGSVSAEHWLGNDNIHFLTSQKTYQLRIDLVDFYGNTSNATYNPFSVGNESVNYELEIGSYSGSAGRPFLGL
ncbi:ficolin-1-A-like [Lytechinus variegatus]|uniref:ficolin-1-A-like n=1 Tax=Lytechinus variegatus TaxID=7654 RepID=UPI001BB1C2B1|nr:ficolin-1-A-like [Lytechinus variegatus]